MKKALDRLYETYDFSGRVSHDPIGKPMRYKRRDDREAVAFLSSALAYGKVELFLGVLDRLLQKMGKHPAGFMAALRPKRDLIRFQGIKYRFNETEDIVALMYAVGRLLKKHGSLERAFLKHYSFDDPNIGNGLAGLVEELLSVDTKPVYGESLRPPGFRFFLPSPRSGSACKRLNLFLRWMVRREDIDFGLWRKVEPSRLVIPLDRHISRVSRCLGFTRRRSDNWKTAVEITEALKAFSPDDPIRYDFALCHRGITGVCAEHRCDGCDLGRFRSSTG